MRRYYIEWKQIIVDNDSWNRHIYWN
jgi:hypothetical protein